MSLARLVEIFEERHLTALHEGKMFNAKVVDTALANSALIYISVHPDCGIHIDNISGNVSGATNSTAEIKLIEYDSLILSGADIVVYNRNRSSKRKCKKTNFKDGAGTSGTGAKTIDNFTIGGIFGAAITTKHEWALNDSKKYVISLQNLSGATAKASISIDFIPGS